MNKFKYRLLIILVFQLFLHWTLQAQTYQVVDVKIEGLEKTSEKYVNRYLATSPGVIVDSSLLERDVQNLSRISSIASASYDIEYSSEGATILFKVEEIGTLLPMFNLGGARESFWILAGAKEVNMLGRGIELGAYYQYYDRHSFIIDYRVPFFGQSSWGMAGSFKKWSTNEPLYWDQARVLYMYDHYNVGVSGIYEFLQENFLETGIAFFREDYLKFSQQDSLPGPSSAVKNKALGKIVLQLDNVKYHYFYQDGLTNSIVIESVYNLGAGGNESPLFVLGWNEFKYFKRITPKINMAVRIKLGLSTNNDSPFAPFVLDNHVNIRGAGTKADRGTGAAFLNAEYRHTLYENHLGAIQGVFLSDMGSWRKPGGDFNDFIDDEIYKIFAGGGLRFIYKKLYGAILRIDYSINLQEFGSQGLVLGVGQYF